MKRLQEIKASLVATGQHLWDVCLVGVLRHEVMGSLPLTGTIVFQSRCRLKPYSSFPARTTPLLTSSSGSFSWSRLVVGCCFLHNIRKYGRVVCHNGDPWCGEVIITVQPRVQRFISVSCSVQYEHAFTSCSLVHTADKQLKSPHYIIILLDSLC